MRLVQRVQLDTQPLAQAPVAACIGAPA